MSTHDTHTQYKLRMPPDLHEQLKQESEKNHRSLNSEIVARLQESFDDRMMYGHKLSPEITTEEFVDLKARVIAVEEASRAMLGQIKREEALDETSDPKSKSE